MAEFGVSCDRCAYRGPGGVCLPNCRDCQEEICASCEEPETRLEDEDYHLTVLCKDCAALTVAWLRGALETAITTETLRAATDESEVSDQYDNPTVRGVDVMSALATRLDAAVAPYTLAPVMAEIANAGDHMDDLFRDDEFSWKWTAAHLRDWLEQELFERLRVAPFVLPQPQVTTNEGDERHDD